MPYYGDTGTTLNDELNRLANGGASYPPRADYLDQAAAAQAWAGVRGVTLTRTDLVGVLNQIALIANPADYKDLAGVCNYLAGTTGFEANAALSQVEN